MNTFQKTIHRTLILLVAFSLAFGSLFYAHEKRAHAQVTDTIGGIFECGAAELIQGLIPSALSVITDTTKVPVSDSKTEERVSSLVTKEFSLDCAVSQVAKTLIEQVTRQIIGWVNSGFDGNPFYVQNPSRFYRNIERAAKERFVQEIENNSNLSTDERRRLVRALEQRNSSAAFSVQVRCGTNVTAGELKDIQDANAGWAAFSEIHTNPGCTDLGRLALAEQRLAQQQATLKESAEQTLEDGFLPEIDPSTGNVVTPGKVISEQVNNQLKSVGNLDNVDEISEIIGVIVDFTLNTIGGGGSLFQINT